MRIPSLPCLIGEDGCDQFLQDKSFNWSLFSVSLIALLSSVAENLNVGRSKLFPPRILQVWFQAGEKSGQGSTINEPPLANFRSFHTREQSLVKENAIVSWFLFRGCLIVSAIWRGKCWLRNTTGPVMSCRSYKYQIEKLKSMGKVK